MFDQTVRPISTLPPGRQVAAKQLEGARSVRALPAGAIITLADIASRQAVLTAAVTLPRGTLLSSDNTTMGYYWGRMPHDAILEPAALPRATATSTLLPGQVLRISGIRSLPAILKGYVRAGCGIGNGAVVDRQFGTTDVFIYFPVSGLDARYKSRFGLTK